MFIISKRNIIIPSEDGRAKYSIPRDYIGEIPGWVSETEYFNELVNDGKISISCSAKDKEIEEAAEIPVTDRAHDGTDEKPKKRVSKVKIEC